MFTQKLTFRSKLVGITALPLALIGYLSFQDVQDALSTRRAAASQLIELDRQGTVATLADAVGSERSVLFDPLATDDDLAARRVEVDNAIAGLRAPDLSLEAGAMAEADQVYAEVVDLRTRIGDGMAPIQQAVSSRDDEARLAAIGEFAQLPQRILEISGYEVSDRETLANLTTTVLLQRARESLALEGTALQQALAEGAPSQSTLERVGALIGSSDEAIDVALHLGVPSQGQAISAYIDSPAWSEYQDLRDQFTRLLIGQHVRLEPTYVLEQRAAVAAEFESHEDDLRATMERDTRALDSQASSDLVLAITISLGALALLTAFLFLLARSIRRSLGRLENRATSIATTELPSIVGMMRTQGDLAEIPTIEKIPVESRDEIGRLSAAFNELHTTAVRLAGEQAASRAVVAHMFVNLGRRNQKLLMRMLQSLDDLERDESDPDRLSKLYGIDHLATRMRRNAESLLILADADVARRFVGPVLVSELLRSTMSEVEEYERIKLNVMDDAEIVGDAAADLAHLLSELTENAARFSPPTEPIEIIARYTRVGYILAVVDSGLGLADDEIVEANARIAAAASSAETPSRNLGLFVVGKLAGKHGMDVEIFERVPAGLTVRVRIPRSMIVSQPPAGVIDTSPAPIAPPREPRPEPRPDAGTAPAEVGNGSQEPVTAASVVRPSPSRSPYEGTSPPIAPPAPPPRPVELEATELQPTQAATTTLAGSADQPAAHDQLGEPSAPTPVPDRRAPSVFTSSPELRRDVDPVFGTRRRVAGANLPEQVESGSRPEPATAVLRRSPEAVGSDLGSLQRGLAGTPGPEVRSEREQ